MRGPLSGGVLVPLSLIADLEVARAARLPLETGGYLIGRRRGVHLEILSATYQGAHDIATRTSFDRADRAHTAQAVAAWRADDGLSDVVGDWHSHPTGAASPSGTDLRAWRQLAHAKCAPVAGLILGDGALSVYLTAARGWPLMVRLVAIEETATACVFARDHASVEGRPPV